jgi:hypothetical protein
MLIKLFNSQTPLYKTYKRCLSVSTIFSITSEAHNRSLNRKPEFLGGGVRMPLLFCSSMPRVPRHTNALSGHASTKVTLWSSCPDMSCCLSEPQLHASTYLSPVELQIPTPEAFLHSRSSMRPFPDWVASLVYFHKIFVVLPPPKHQYFNVRRLTCKIVVPQKMRAYGNVSCTNSAATQNYVHINLNFFALTNPKQNVEKALTSSWSNKTKFCPY